MNRKSILALIVVGLISLLSILIIQYMWMKKTISIQKVEVAMQEKEDSLNQIQFSEQVHVALSHVLKDLNPNLQNEAAFYGAIKQIRSNYFTAEINEEINPFYLETLLKRHLYNNGIRDDFQYGVYDCFTDSIVYGELIRFSKDSAYLVDRDTTQKEKLPQLRPNNDGHYFSVFFPKLKSNSIDTNVKLYSPWIYIVLVLFLVLVFFVFSLTMIIRQKRISEIKNDFINNMTHELKTPISTIGLSSEMLMKLDFKEDPERLKKYAQIIFKENKRLENQVERVLNVAKLDKEKIALQPEIFDLHELLVDVKENVLHNQMQEDGEILLHLNAENHTLKVDPVHITNVVYNLIDNAIKYCEDIPKIEIHTYNEKQSFVLEIKDNGIGIKKEHIKTIFEKFYRVPTGNLHNVKGFGLGLFYVKLIIESHGGTVIVNSEWQKGSKFTLKLPL